MQTVDYIICGEYILTMNKKLDMIHRGAVAIKDARIIDLGTADELLEKYTAGRIMEGEGRVVLPGLVNTHTHAAMVYFRGLADDLPLKQWLEGHIWPAETRWLSPGFVFDAVELACLEMLKGGVTTYCDMYFFGDSTARATKEMGMRAVVGVGIVDFPTVSAKTADEYLANAERFIHDWKGDEMITPCVAPHSIYTCGPETLKKAKALADTYRVPLQTHLAETEWEVGEIVRRYGKRPVEYLEEIGFFGETVIAAHCIMVKDNEIEILSRRKVGVSHCMESNLKLASGFAPVATMVMEGVKVTFGTDGAASNNDLNIFSEMSTTAKVHKTVANDPSVLDARTILVMATRWGAEVLGLGDSLGSIEKGKLADMITVNLRKPHLVPLYDIYSHLVYSAMASDVETVMVNGKIIVDQGRHTSTEEDRILSKAIGWGVKIAQCNARQ